MAEVVGSLSSMSVTAVAVYLHLAVLSAVVSSAFCSLVNERFDPQTARRVFGRIATGGTVGAVVGGFAAWHARWQIAMSLLEATGANPSLTPPRDAVLAAAQRELEATVAGAPVLDAGDDLASSLVDEELRARVDRRLECIFAILSLALDRDPLRIAFRALASSDRSLRGTALEYLDNVLPDSLRDGLRPLLGERRPTGAPPRPRQQIVAELLLSASTPRPAKTPS